MRSLVLFSFLGVLVLASCEDNKKASPEKIEISKDIRADTVSTNVSFDTANTSEVKKYPKITPENVVDFLTQYGTENPETRVRISSMHGNIEIELYKDTPLHRANFIYLVKQKYFDNTFFHRVVPNFIIQGGNSDLQTTPNKRSVIGATYLLPAELANGRKHTYGTVSGAKEYRENPDKKSAPFEFFIFLGPDKHTAHLNGNYTIFGRVTKGMDIVEKIANLEADEGEWPLQNVYIKAEIIE